MSGLFCGFSLPHPCQHPGDRAIGDRRNHLHRPVAAPSREDSRHHPRQEGVREVRERKGKCQMGHGAFSDSFCKSSDEVFISSGRSPGRVRRIFTKL